MQSHGSRHPPVSSCSIPRLRAPWAPTQPHSFPLSLWEAGGNLSRCHIRPAPAGPGSPAMPSGRGECQLCGGSRRRALVLPAPVVQSTREHVHARAHTRTARRWGGHIQRSPNQGQKWREEAGFKCGRLNPGNLLRPSDVSCKMGTDTRRVGVRHIRRDNV